MALDASQEVPAEQARPALTRRAERVAVSIRASLYHAESFEPVVICDISRYGAGIGRCRSVMPNDEVTIKLLDDRKLKARVRWWLAGRCGVLFDEPLQSNDRLLSTNTVP